MVGFESAQRLLFHRLCGRPPGLRLRQPDYFAIFQLTWIYRALGLSELHRSEENQDAYLSIEIMGILIQSGLTMGLIASTLMTDRN
jgi:hypothetical protein